MKQWGTYALVYLAAVNFLAFWRTGWDKYKAKHHKWRTPEKTLVSFSVLGGGIGTLGAFYLFRHKIKHKKLLFAVYFFTAMWCIGGICLYVCKF